MPPHYAWHHLSSAVLDKVLKKKMQRLLASGKHVWFCVQLFFLCYFFFFFFDNCYELTSFLREIIQMYL